MERDLWYVQVGPLCTSCSKALIEEVLGSDWTKTVKIDAGQLEKEQGYATKCAVCGMGRFSQL